MRVVLLLGILDPDPRRRKRTTAKTPRRTTTFCSASTPSPGHLDISTPRSFLGFRSASPIVHAPQLGRRDELAWAALNREQQSSLLAELRELPDIERLLRATPEVMAATSPSRWGRLRTSSMR